MKSGSITSHRFLEDSLRRAITRLRHTERLDLMFWADALESELSKIPLQAQALGETLSLHNPAVNHLWIEGCYLSNTPSAWILLWRITLTGELRELAKRIFAGQPDWREFALLFDRDGE